MLTNGVFVLLDGVLSLAFVLALVMLVIGVCQQ
jgi:hypothetical protein